MGSHDFLLRFLLTQMIVEIMLVIVYSRFNSFWDIGQFVIHYYLDRKHCLKKLNVWISDGPVSSEIT